MNIEEQRKEFEEWLRRVCFQKPTPEAYDLAWQAWYTAQQSVLRMGLMQWLKWRVKVMYARYLWWRA